MAKKVQGYIKLQVPAGSANPSPPIGPALGQQGVNIMEFCKQFNAQTQKMEKEFATGKFAETVDAAVNLGIDASKSDQQVRGSTVMPHGTGKTVRVAVFTSGKNQELAKAAGADIVGLEDLAAKVKAGEINFDRVIASPDAMRLVGQLGQLLGPRGLMPK